MSQSLQERVEHVQRRAARLMWLYGWSRFAVAAALAVACVAAMDYLLRVQHPAARWPLSITAAALILAAFAKLAWPVVAFRQNSVTTAQRIEFRFPQLGERLSSAIAFLHLAEADRVAGSAGLRRAVVAEAEAASAQLNFGEVLNRKPSGRAALAAAICWGAVFIAVAFNPAVGRLAISRLAMPWRDQPWPRRNELVVVEPQRRVKSGDDLEIAVEDRRGKLPESVELLVHSKSAAGPRTERQPMKLLGERMLYRLENVTQSFWYRARGGDDNTMPWMEVTVVEPPKVIELTMTVEPPEYTGLAARTSGRVVKALVGSKLQVRGRLDKPIRSAIAKSPTADFSAPTVTVAADGLSFAAPASGVSWLIERSGSVWFELADAQGLILDREIRLEMQATEDLPPSIAWESPGEQSVLTAKAALAVKGLVKDDLAVQAVQLRYVRPGSNDEEQIIELDQTAAAGIAGESEGEARVIDFAWDLGLLGLSAGDELAVRITAEDNKPQLATTAVRRLKIITEEELASRVATRQGATLQQLAESLRLARRVQDQTSSLASRLRETPGVHANDVDQLQSIQHGQRQVQQLLDDSSSGVAGQLEAILAELAANRATDQAASQRLDELAKRVRSLNQEEVLAIDQSLTAAIQAVREAMEARGPDAAGAAARSAAANVEAAEAAQKDLIEELARMLDALTELDSLHKLAREVGRMLADEEQLARETDALIQTTISVAGLPSAADQHRARQLSQRQLNLARELDKLQTQMEEAVAKTKAADPLAARSLESAFDTARSTAIGGQMREAAAQLSQFRLGEGRRIEQVVLDGLKKLYQAFVPDQDKASNESASKAEQAGDGDLMARLKLVLLRQQEVNRRTAELEATRERNGQLTPEQQSELSALAKEQGGLAETLLDVARPRNGRAEGVP